MVPKIIRCLECIGGATLILLGVFGMLIPILPGFPLFLGGIALISPVFGKTIIEKLKNALHRFNAYRKS